MKRLRQIFAGTVAVGFGLLLTGGAAPPTHAAPATVVTASTQYAPTGLDNPDVDYDSTSDWLTSRYTHNLYLPMNRWLQSSAGFHDQFDSFITSQLTEKAMRGIQQTSGMLVGNTMYFSTGEVVRMASSFDVLGNQVGAAADRSAGLIGTTLTTNPLLVGSILTLVVTGILWQAWRSQGSVRASWRRVGGVAVILILMAVMSAAASQGEAVTSADGVTTYDAPTGSPVWAASAVSDSISRFAAVPAAAMVDWGQSASAETADTPYSCGAFKAALGLESDLRATFAAPDIASVTKIINGLWEETGLATWKVAQFGGNNQYGDFMYCRVLDQFSPTVTSGNSNFVTRVSADGTSSAGNTRGTTGATSPIFITPKNEDFDKTMIAWASCRPNTTNPVGSGSFTVAAGWETKRDGSTWIAPANCWSWWSASNPGDIPGVFKIGGSPSDIRSLTSDSRVLDFVNALHGSSLGAIVTGTIAIGAYIFSAFLTMLVFMGIALAVIVAKIYALVLIILLFIIMIVALFARNSAMERLTPILQKFLGITVFSFGISLILSLVAVLTKLLIDVGVGLGGPGNPVSLLWAGIAPLISLVLLHNIFTKVLKMPSPITPAGALAWGTAGGAAGAAIGTSLVNRAQNRTRGAAKGAASRVASGGLNKATGGRFGNAITRHGMGGGPKRGAVGGTAGGDGRLLGSSQTLAATQDRKTALAEYRAANPNAVRRLGARAKSSTGRVLSAPKRGLQAADNYINSDATQRVEIRAAARERLHAGLTEVRDHTQRAASRVASAPYGARTALDSATTSIYDGAGRAASATKRAAVELRQHPGSVASAGASGLWNGTKAATRSPVAKTALKGTAVAGAVALGPITAIPAAGYLAHKARASMRNHKAAQDTAVAAYTTKQDEQKAPAGTPEEDTPPQRRPTTTNTEPEKP